MGDLVDCTFRYFAGSKIRKRTHVFHPAICIEVFLKSIDIRICCVNN